MKTNFGGEDMNRARRILSFFVVVIVLLGGFIDKPVPAKAIKNFTVEVSPKICGKAAEYRFQFTFEDPLKPHQYKGFLFPPGTTLKPPLPDNEEERKNRLKEIANAFRIENKEPEDYHTTGLPVIEDKNGWLNIRFSSNSILVPDKEGSHTVTMIFSEKAGICNPSKAGEYIYKLAIQYEPGYMESQPVTILSQDAIIIQLTIGSMQATVNGEAKILPLTPFIQKGYTLVPFRFIGEALHATVDFTTDPFTKQVKTVTYELDGTEIVLTIGYLRGMVNGNAILLDVPPQIKNGTTVVPLRFVSTNLGCKVDWDPVQQKITISYSEKPNNGDTVTVVEDFDSIWLMKSSLFDQPKKELLEELGSNYLVYITYYVDSTDDHPFPRLSCPEAENRMKWYMKDKGIPSYFFNGTNNIRGIPSDGGDIANDIKKALKKNILAVNRRVSPVKLSATCTHLVGSTYKIQLEVQRQGAVNFADLQLVSVLTESNIPYIAISGRKIHNYVFREFIKPKELKDSIGIPINLAVAGGNFKTEFTFDLNTDLYKKELNLVFFVQDMTQKAILQGVTIPLMKQ
jgi:hypothetical protein